MAGYTYRHSNTGDVYHCAERNPELDALPNWTLQEHAEVPDSAVTAAERAAATIDSIEAAATNRLDRTQAATAGQVAHATTRLSSSEAGVPVPTLSDAEPVGEADQTPLLSSDKSRGGTVGVGGREIPTRDELERRAAEDLANPPKTGVLGRARADQRAGRTQIGPNPEEHTGQRAAEHGQTAEPGAGATEPAGNATEEEWRTWVITKGLATEEEATKLGRNALRDKYGSSKPS